MKGLMKVYSGGSTMSRGWRMIRLLKESMYESVLVVAQWAGGRDGRYREGVFKEKRVGCQASKDNGAGSV